MPFGKANSSKVFCHWVSNWCSAFKGHWGKLANFAFVLESYVDDIFGGADTKANAALLKNQLIALGKLTSTIMNLEKCQGPATVMTILGFLYDACMRRVSLPEKKRLKYLQRLRSLLAKPTCRSRELERLLGYLGFASWVEPFGRPFLSALSSELERGDAWTTIRLGSYTILALQIWERILVLNRGSSYRFVLNRLPTATSEIFVDAASSWGIGGLFGDRYFMIPNRDLLEFHRVFSRCRGKRLMGIPSDKLPIAYLELLAATVAIACFAHLCRDQLVRLNCDNTDAVAWLRKSRCSAGVGFRLLAVAEFYKHKYCFKVSTRHIPGVSNTSADMLSRGSVPGWLLRHGHRKIVDIAFLVDIMLNPLTAWSTIL